MNTKSSNIPEVFSCIRKAFEYVKKEVVENGLDTMKCQMTIEASEYYGDKMYIISAFDFLAELEWEDEECSRPVCNISILHFPYRILQKKDKFDSLFKQFTTNKPDWLKDVTFEMEWGKEEETFRGMVYPVEITVHNLSPEMAMRIISFEASYFLPTGKELYISTDFCEEIDGPYEYICDFHPDEGELITKTNQ